MVFNMFFRNPDDSKPLFHLHPCLRDHHTELTYLGQLCEYILILTLPPESARISSLRFILREVLAGLGWCDYLKTIAI